MKCSFLTKLIGFAAFIGLVAAAPAASDHEQAVEKCRELILNEASSIQIPKAVHEFVNHIKKQEKVESIDEVDNEVLAKYTKPSECDGFVQKMKAIENIAAYKHCDLLSDEEIDQVEERLGSSMEAHLGSAVACLFGFGVADATHE